MDYDFDLSRNSSGTFVPARGFSSPFQTDVDLTSGYGEHGFPIKFEFEFARELQLELSNALDIQPFWKYSPNSSWPHHVRSEVYRFYLALRTYLESESPLLSRRELLDGVISYQYVTWLKKIRSWISVKTGTGFFLDESEFGPEVREWARGKSLTDLGQMFNPRYWINWELPDDEDWRWFYEPAAPINKESLDLLYEHVRNILPEQVDMILEEEVLLETTGSKAMNLKDKEEKNRDHWDLKGQGQNFFETKPLEGKGAFIQTFASETRYAVTLSVPHSNSVKLIEKQVSLIAEDLPYSNYVKDPKKYQKRS